LVVRDDVVFWAREAEGARQSILSCASTGCSGAPQVIASDVELTKMAVDATHVYWSSFTEGKIMRCARTGADTPRAVVSNELSVRQIAVDSTHVYWIANAGQPNAAVRRIAKHGDGAPATLIAAQNQASALAVHAGSFYWSNAYAVGDISRCPSSGCAGSPTTLVAEQARPSALATDGRTLAWINVLGNSSSEQMRGSVARCLVENCVATVETFAVQAFASDGLSLAVDANDV
jgi:hypothetical protein